MLRNPSGRKPPSRTSGGPPLTPRLVPTLEPRVTALNGENTRTNPSVAPRSSYSVHVLVHVRIRRYCHLLRHPAKSKWHAGLLVCVGYASPCVDVQLAATVQVLDSKPVGGNSMGVRLPLSAPIHNYPISNCLRRQSACARQRRGSFSCQFRVQNRYSPYPPYF